MSTLVGFIFERAKIAVNAASTKASTVKTFQAMNNAQIISSFQHVACLHMKFGKTEEVGGSRSK